MTDLDLIQQLRPEVPLASGEELAPARARLIAGMAAAPSGSAGISVPPGSPHQPAAPGPGAGRRRRASVWPAGRLRLAGVAAAAAVAGVVTALVVVPGHGGPGSRPAPDSHPSGSHPAGSRPFTGSHPVTGELTVAGFLHAAASAALRQPPTTPPTPNQFVYAETGAPGPGGASSRYQIWQSADGTRPGLIIQPAHMPFPPCDVAQAEAGRCAVAAGYLPDLPARPGAAFRYLIKVKLLSTADEGADPAPDTPHWVANDVGKEAMSMLSSMYLRPGQRAALYELMAGIPGFRIVREADVYGHRGIGIAWTYLGFQTTIVFSPRTYAYLGVTQIGDHGRTRNAQLLLAFGIVDRAGQLPGPGHRMLSPGSGPSPRPAGLDPTAPRPARSSG